MKTIKQDLKQNSGDDDLSFLTETVPTKHDTDNQLRFEIAKDIYLSKKALNDAARVARENKEHNEKILALINDKQEGELKSKSVEELTAMLK